MQRRQMHVLQSFRALRAFLGRHQLEIRLGSLAPQLAALDAVVASLTTFQGEQDTRSRMSRRWTRTLAQATRDLRRHYMTPVSILARRHLIPDPSLAAAMTIPRDRSPERLAAAAMAMADAAEPMKQAYVDAGYAPDFTEQMRERARALTSLLDERHVHVARRQASTAGIRDAVRQGQAIVSLLDSLVVPALNGDASLEAEWRALRRQVSRRRLRGETPPAQPPDASTSPPRGPILQATGGLPPGGQAA